MKSIQRKYLEVRLFHEERSLNYAPHIEVD